MQKVLFILKKYYARQFIIYENPVYTLIYAVYIIYIKKSCYRPGQALRVPEN